MLFDVSRLHSKQLSVNNCWLELLGVVCRCVMRPKIPRHSEQTHILAARFTVVLLFSLDDMWFWKLCTSKNARTPNKPRFCLVDEALCYDSEYSSRVI